MTTAPEPAWLLAARAKLGTRETPGMAFDADPVPLCGLFVVICMAKPGINAPPIGVHGKARQIYGAPTCGSSPSIPVRSCASMATGGGHVGFYLGHDSTHFHVLGGNQGDCVSMTQSRATAGRDPLLQRRPGGRRPSEHGRPTLPRHPNEG
jgi:hypothetical protein